MRTRLFAVSVVWWGVGCAAPIDVDEVDPADEAVGESQSPLFLVANKWPANEFGVHEIPVCFEPEALAHPEFASLQARVRRAANTSWARVANIVFKGFGACGTSARIQIHVREAGSSTGGKIGYQGEGEHSYIGLVDKDWYGPIDEQRWDFEGAVVHELGHNLGFQHDFSRPDWPAEYEELYEAGCRPRGTTNGDTLGTPVDVRSIMVSSYCGTREEPWLSPWDIVGVQNAYGRKGRGMIVGRDNQCVDIPGGSPENGEDLQVYHCHGGYNQRWRWQLNKQLNPTAFPSSGLTMDVAGGSDAGNRAPVQVYTEKDPATANQQFSFSSVELVGIGDFCVETSSSDSTRVQIATCDGGSNQRWELVPVGILSSESLFSIKQGSQCLEVTDSSTEPRTLLKLTSCFPRAALFSWGATGALEWSGMCVDVRGGDPVEGARLQIYSCKSDSDVGVANQRFHVRGQIRALNRCLDIRGGVGVNNAALQIYDCKTSNNANQIWEYYPDIRESGPATLP
jgi:hypothetical protein